MECDYAHLLSKEEAAYLDKFNEEFENASFGDDPLHTDEEQRREIGRIKAHRTVDIYGRGLRSSAEPHAVDVADRSWSGDPHLETPGYREALSEFRAVLPKDRRENASNSPEFLAAQAKIDSLAGVITSSARGVALSKMAKTRLERLRETRETVWNIGVLLAKSMFKGDEAMAVASSFRWLEAVLSKTDEKLKNLGVDVSKLPGYPKDGKGE